MRTLCLCLLVLVLCSGSEAMVDHRFRPGESLRAYDINNIVDALLHQITGGKGIQVRTFGDRLILTKAQIRDPKVPCPKRILSDTPTALYADPTTGLLFIGMSVPGGPARFYRWDGTGTIDTASYVELLGETVYDFIRHPVEGVLYACTGDSYGYILRSADDGDTWTQVRKTTPGYPLLQHPYPITGLAYEATYGQMLAIDHDPGGVVNATLFWHQYPGNDRWFAQTQSRSMEGNDIDCDPVEFAPFVAGDSGFFRKDGGGGWSTLGTPPGYDTVEYEGKVYNSGPFVSTDQLVVRRASRYENPVVFRIDGQTGDAGFFAASSGGVYFILGTVASGTQVYYSDTGDNGTWERIGDACPSWGGDNTEIKSAAHFNSLLFVGSDGLWQCPASW